MEVIESIRTRRSIRAFKPDPVPGKVLEELLETCLWAPSSQNTQTWEFAILGGKVMEEVKARLTENTKANVATNPDLPPFEVTGSYLQRATELRDSIDTHQFPPGTDKLDEKRAEYWVRGARFYDAPNAILLCAEKSLYPKAIVDIGIMAQTIFLAALAYGLGVCIMIRPINWPDMLRELLGMPKSKLILLGLAIGYPDSEALLNNFKRHREPLETFAKWYGFD